MSQLALAVQFDYGYLSEMSTRLSIVASEELEPFLSDLRELLGVEYPDYFLVGYRVGMLWQTIFDVKLS